jgi:hypothetical protein
MSFLKKLFGQNKEVEIFDNTGFWNWFTQNEKTFYNVLKKHQDADENFLQKIMPKLQQLNPGFFCLAGMYNETTAELVITAEGDIKTFVFAEELVASAPVTEGWKFTALKPYIDAEDMNISMDGFEFNSENIGFFSNDNKEYPDVIDITAVHRDFTEENKDIITTGTFIYIDNKLGELNAATLLDSVLVSGPSQQNPELIPIDKLKEFLTWREKEFLEKYKGARYHTDEDNYSSLEGEDEKGIPLIAIVNTDLLNWDAKPSYPWMMVITITYTPQNNGMPDTNTYQNMNRFEDELVAQLPDAEGYLNLGRETYNGTRTIYFVCREFRKSSKITNQTIHNYLEHLDITYEIYKDKYWTTMNKFSNNTDS